MAAGSLKVTYDFHDICFAFPKIEGADREAFKKSIADSGGPKTPVLIWEDEADGRMKIIDGRNRAEICDELNIQYDTKVFKGTYVEMIAEIGRINLYRRNLTETQRAASQFKIDQLSKHYQERAGHKGGRPAGIKDGERAESSIAESSEKAGVSKGTTKRVRKAATNKPELLQEMIDGKKSAREAEREVLDEQRSGPTGPLLSDDEGEEAQVLSIADAASERMKAFNRQLDATARYVMAYKESMPTGLDDSTLGIIESQARALAGTIRQQKGDGLCAYCCAKGCDRCGHRGFLSKTSLASVPQQVTDAAEIEWAKAA